jgi:NADPH:quinone reductase-like Zn-dependent oxidoreductase
MVIARGELTPGETVLIHGVGGGVALAALQWTILAGGRAIVTSSSREKLDRAREIGAAETIRYTETDDLGARVCELTGGRGVDLVIDSVGAATIGAGVSAVRRGGRIVLCGVTSGAAAEVDLRAVYWNQIRIIGSTMGSDEDFRLMLLAADAGGLRPRIHETFGLGEIRRAMGTMERGEQFGKIALEIS